MASSVCTIIHAAAYQDTPHCQSIASSRLIGMVPVCAWPQLSLIAFCLLMAQLLLRCTSITALRLHCHMDTSRLQAVFADSILFLLSATVRTGDSCTRAVGITQNRLLIVSPFDTWLSGGTTAGLELASACALELSDTLLCQGHLCRCLLSSTLHGVCLQLTMM